LSYIDDRYIKKVETARRISVQARVTRMGIMMIFGIIGALVGVTVAVVQPGDAAAGSGPEGKADPSAVVGHVVENTPGFWTPEKMDEAEPMPLLPPDHETGPGAHRPGHGRRRHRARRRPDINRRTASASQNRELAG
jgi:hypothetical protein